jgi:hypothetical protein
MAMSSAGSEVSLADAVRNLLINYLQVSALAAGFPLDWPGPMEVLFELQGSVSTAGEHLLSPDCELSVLPAADACYTKQIAYSFAPLFIVGVSFAIWRLIACARKEPWRGERDEARGHRIDATTTTPKDRAVLTLILLLYMIYPTICQQTLSMLACRRVEAWQLPLGRFGGAVLARSASCVRPHPGTTPGHSFSTSLACPSLRCS